MVVIRDRRIQLLFAHVFRRKGLAHEHGSQVLIKDIRKIGHQELILKCDGEPALRSIQEEVKRMRQTPTLLENSGAGGIQANGAVEEAVPVLGEQVRVLRQGLGAHMGSSPGAPFHFCRG